MEAVRPIYRIFLRRFRAEDELRRLQGKVANALADDGSIAADCSEMLLRELKNSWATTPMSWVKREAAGTVEVEGTGGNPGGNHVRGVFRVTGGGC